MWLTVRDGLQWTLAHDWSEFMQLRIYMGRSEPVPNPEITTHFLGMVFIGQYPQLLDVDAAQGREFRAVMAFTDPGVSSFTIEVSEGVANVRPGEAEKADLVIIQSAENFEKTRNGIQSLADGIQKGEVQVNDKKSLATFGELFPR
jgi:alkyl sulfatase BDS1-like metallo-beta-lactamase superfamily hydrolase